VSLRGAAGVVGHRFLWWRLRRRGDGGFVAYGIARTRRR
jgi:hypothetical protein